MKKNFAYRLLEKTSKPVWLTVLIALYLLFQYVFNGMFSVSTTHLKEISGGYSIPDLWFYYTPEQLHETFRHFGSAGISEYLKLQWIDMIYPLVYSLLLASLLFIAFRNRKWKGTIYLPFVAAFFDYFENFTLRYLATSFPDFSNGLAHFAAFCTAWKWIFVYLSILFVLFGLIRWLILRFSHKKG